MDIINHGNHWTVWTMFSFLTVLSSHRRSEVMGQSLAPSILFGGCKLWTELRVRLPRFGVFVGYSWQPFGNDESLPSKVWRCFGTMYPTFSWRKNRNTRRARHGFSWLAFKVDSFHKSKKLSFICFFGQNVLIGLIGFIVLWYFSTTSFLSWHLAASTWYCRIRQDFGCWQVRISGSSNL